MIIPNRTFIMRPAPDPSVVGRSSPGKQNRVCHDAVGKRNIIFGGDYTNTLVNQTAAGMTWSLDPVLDLAGDSKQGWRQISGECHGPGKLTPARPDDSQACGMDYKLDAFTVNPGGWRLDADGTVCPFDGNAQCFSTAGSIYYQGAMRMDRSGNWTGISKDHQVPGGKNGHFDPVRRCLVSVDSAAAAINRFFVDTATSDSIPLDPVKIGATYGDYHVLGRLFSPSYMGGIDWGIDIVSRWGYVLSVGDVYAKGNPDHSEMFLWRFNLDNPAIQQALADPPFGSKNTYTTLSPTGYPYVAAGTDRFRTQWDSRNRRLMWFYTRSICGMVHGVAAYNPTTNTWETFPITQNIPVGLQFICATAHGYDSTNNVHILIGGQFAVPNDDQTGEEMAVGASANYYTYWRYA